MSPSGREACHRSFFGDDEERAFLEPEGRKRKTEALGNVAKEEMALAEEAARLGMKTRGSPCGAASPVIVSLCVELDCLT